MASDPEDGFEGYEDRSEGDDQQHASCGIIVGNVLKFTNDYKWVTRNGEELSPDLELVVVDVARVVQKWKNGRPVETIVLQPGQKFPDLEDLNEKTPRGEWVKGPDGQPCGPWQAQHIPYLMNPATLDRYSFPTGTTGGAIAVRELVNKVKWMRKFHGVHVYPVVTLSDTFLHTRFGGRQRPHFIVKRWIDLGGDEKTLPAPGHGSPPTAAQLENFATKKPEEKTTEATAEPEKNTTTTKRGVTRFNAPTVEEPALREELDDEIPF